MQVLYSRCAGLDVHKDAVVASARPASGRDAGVAAQTFATTTAGLLALSAWSAERGCTHLAMEATGVYWKPVRHVLSDGDFTLVPADAAQVKNAPGRESDVADATWLAESLARMVRCAPASSPTRPLRRCVPRCEPASSWSASAPATSSGCGRRSRTPTSSSARRRPTSRG